MTGKRTNRSSRLKQWKNLLAKSRTILAGPEMYPPVSKRAQRASNKEIPERKRLQNRELAFFTASFQMSN